jgi:hypothetical protein
MGKVAWLRGIAVMTTGHRQGKKALRKRLMACRHLVTGHGYRTYEGGLAKGPVDPVLWQYGREIAVADATQ